jgi:hypothetical protein
MSQNSSAAGYESVRGSLYAPPKIVAKTVELYHECAITPQIARSDFLSDDELFCGSRVIFGVEQDLNLFSQDTDNNEHPETASGPLSGEGSLTVCNNQKFEIKITNNDKRIMCGNYGAWETNVRKQIDKAVVRLVDNYSIPKIMASAHADNVGHRAGKLSHSIDLGWQDNLALDGNTKAGFESMILNLREVAQEAGIVCAQGSIAGVGDSGMPTILIPSKLERYALALMKDLDTCCSDKNAMRTGLIGSLYGMNIISSTRILPKNYGAAGNLAPVMLIDPSQVLHAFDVINDKWYEGKFEDYLVGEFVWETHVFNPHGVAVAISKV